MIEIDQQSGFCFGVVTAIKKAEEELQNGSVLYCLGDIVHNNAEVERLSRLGLKTITHNEFLRLSPGSRVLIRAHGEPPSTYLEAAERGIEIVDASCPVVRSLQKKIRNTYLRHTDAQIIIFGKPGHAEVVGLQGQTDNTAIVINRQDDASTIDLKRDIFLFSQTTKAEEDFKRLVAYIEKSKSADTCFSWHDTICQQVRNRVNHIRLFAEQHDKIVFVGGRNSSNGKVLYEHCKEVNPDTLFIESADDLTDDYIASCRGLRIGICGATSTPLWLMQQCAERLEQTEQ